MSERTEQKFFERQDQWNYVTLLLELYRNCILSMEPYVLFYNNVEKFWATIVDYPELKLRTIIEEQLPEIIEERKQGLKDARYKRDHPKEVGLRSTFEYNDDCEAVEYRYYYSLFSIIRDELAKHGAFSHYSGPKEEGYQIDRNPLQ